MKPSPGGGGWLSKRWLLAKKLRSQAQYVHRQGFMLRVVVCVKKETIMENQTLLVQLHVSKDNSHLTSLPRRKKGKKVTVSSWPTPHIARSHTHLSTHATACARHKRRIQQRIRWVNKQIRGLLCLHDSEMQLPDFRYH